MKRYVRNFPFKSSAKRNVFCQWTNREAKNAILICNDFHVCYFFRIGYNSEKKKFCFCLLKKVTSISFKRNSTKILNSS